MAAKTRPTELFANLAIIFRPGARWYDEELWHEFLKIISRDLSTKKQGDSKLSPCFFFKLKDSLEEEHVCEQEARAVVVNGRATTVLNTEELEVCTEQPTRSNRVTGTEAETLNFSLNG